MALNGSNIGESQGNPHATCDVAGAGNGVTASPKRAPRGKPRTQAKDEPTGYRASARPYQVYEMDRAGGNAPRFDLRGELYRITGVDLTRIDGVHVMIAQTILSPGAS